MKPIYKITLIIVLLTSSVVTAQQDPNFTLYNYNMNLINPAYAGIQEASEISIAYRSQWLGVPNAPSTKTITYNTSLQKNLGLGISVISDEVFVLNETDIAVDISYKVQLSETHKLYFGLKAGGGFVSIDLSKSGAPGNDPLFTNNQSFFNPHVGAGLYLKHKNYYVTVSTPNFLSGKRYEKQGNRPAAAVDNAHWYLGTGYIFTINDNYTLTPAVMMRAVNGAPSSYDVSATLDMYNKFTAGANLRTGETLSLYALVKVLRNKVRFGFAYDMTTSQAKEVVNDGSLEFLVKYQF